jgi:mannose/fructose/N-acetylgalactosamine-specific phosphotransferase system component IID
MSKDNGKQQDQKVISKMFKHSWFLFSSFNMVKMQGYGYEYAMLPAID